MSGSSRKETLRALPRGVTGDSSPRHRLIHATGDHPLEYGSLLVGREAECDIALDDALASRRHARITTDATGTTITDLRSANGTWINGQRVTAPRRLVLGDWLVIGSTDMQFVDARASMTIAATTARREDPAPTSYRFVGEGRPRTGPRSRPRPAAAPVSGPPPSGARPTAGVGGDAEPSTGQVDAFQLLGSIAEKALAQGQHDRAADMLGPHLRNVLQQARQSSSVAPETADFVGRFAVRLAAATQNAGWVDQAVELFTIARRPLPAAAVDLLATVVRQLPGVDRTAFRNYVVVLRASVDRFSAADRFLLLKIAELEPTIMSRA